MWAFQPLPNAPSGNQAITLDGVIATAAQGNFTVNTQFKVDVTTVFATGQVTAPSLICKVNWTPTGVFATGQVTAPAAGVIVAVNVVNADFLPTGNMTGITPTTGRHAGALLLYYDAGGGSMTYKDVALQTDSWSGGLTLNEPGTAAAGDVYVAVIGYRGSNNFSTPSGWIKRAEQGIANTTINGISGIVVFDRIRGSSAPSLFFDRVSEIDVVSTGTIISFSLSTGQLGVDTATSATLGTANTVLTVPGLTPSGRNRLVVGCYSGSGQGGWSAEATTTVDLTERFEHVTSPLDRP